MINELDNNKRSLNAMSDLEFAKNELEMMRYRPNTLSYKLGLCGLACSVMAAFLGLNAMNPCDFQVILKILINISILLLGFLACEQAKDYSKRGSTLLIGLGAVCGLRIFWIPLGLMVTYSQYVAAYNEFIEPFELYTAEAAKESPDATLLAKYQELYAPAKARIEELGNSPFLGNTIQDGFGFTNSQVAILPSNGYFRGITAIVFLGVAAALMITAGIIGIIQSKKITNYMASLNQKK